jgi:hypothetical protein
MTNSNKTLNLLTTNRSFLNNTTIGIKHQDDIVNHTSPSVDRDMNSLNGGNSIVNFNNQ